MSARAKIEKAYQLVEAGRRALDAGEEEEGSRLMWEAARAGISAVAETRGWTHETFEDLYAVLHRLDAEVGNHGFGSAKEPRTPYIAEFVFAENYGRRTLDPIEYFSVPEDARWTSWEFKDRQVWMKPFIARLAELVYEDESTP